MGHSFAGAAYLPKSDITLWYPLLPPPHQTAGKAKAGVRVQGGRKQGGSFLQRQSRSSPDVCGYTGLVYQWWGWWWWEVERRLPSSDLCWLAYITSLAPSEHKKNIIPHISPPPSFHRNTKTVIYIIFVSGNIFN